MENKDLSFRSYTDLHSLDRLKLQAKANDPKALETVAKQFESLFLNMLLKNMRKANEGFSEGGYFDSNQTRFYQDMLDQQMSLSVSSGKGIGISEVLIRQLSPKAAPNEPLTDAVKTDAVKTRAFNKNVIDGGETAKETDDKGKEKVAQPSLTERQLFEQAMEYSARAAIEVLAKREHGNQIPNLPQLKPGDFTKTLNAMESSLATENIRGIDTPAVKATMDIVRSIITDEGVPSASVSQAQVALPERFSVPADFVQGIYPLAVNAAAEIGVDPEVLVAQAALETGWGRHLPANADGSSSFNLFGIKADQRWHGNSVMVDTLEFKNGIPAPEKAAFRSYDSYADSLQDYASFITLNSRYRNAVNQAASGVQYLQQLQVAGYATDPEYARKISDILSGDVMNSALAAIKET